MYGGYCKASIEIFLLFFIFLKFGRVVNSQYACDGSPRICHQVISHSRSPRSLCQFLAHMISLFFRPASVTTEAAKSEKKTTMMELVYQMLSSMSFSHPAAIVSLLLLVVLFLYWYGTRGFADLKKLNVPGPKPVPFLGNLLELRKYDGMHLMFLDYIKKYGKVFAFCLGRRPSLVVADPELLKQIMIKDFPSFHNRFQI